MAHPAPEPVHPSDRQELLASLAEGILGLARELTLFAPADPEAVRLTATEIHVMRQILRDPGCMPKEAARGASLQRSNFSVALRGLRAKGLVAAEPDPADGRSLRLWPTERAAWNHAHFRRTWAALLDAALDPALDVAACAEVLGRMEAQVAARRRRGPVPPGQAGARVVS
ncbi:MarR family winged helix-turn-helix transcriptional regulator [Mesoterricola sediminis]|uniref:HTH marR-type domain-containing protein n=1 Tax=Mesoterricola sediminis TaxID=2927980 RepID=A0AA48H5H4_9BACT|nr:MarR family transcriptional regulator [Mesoterricola sediminis]BDU77761.1 hypothetical protein METESE_27190 [Mesoterricola sediminis]